MSKTSRTNRFFILSFLTTVLFWAHTGFAEGPAGDQVRVSGKISGEMFLPSDQAMTDVAQAMKRARDRAQLVLVILGANWCHDSRALAARIYQEPLSTLIEAHYQVVFVDVAFLDQGREVIESIGPPVYYATPTVLIVDPLSGVLVNANNRHQWGDASNISMDKSVEYFQRMADTRLSDEPKAEPESETLQIHFAEIDAFENKQAERLYEAYAVLGPLLRSYKAGENPEKFEAYWNEVRQFRLSVARDMDSLRAFATEQALADSDEFNLDYPAYPPFSWESGD